jgi:predicted site-specific integrase-resolvase
MEYEKLLTTGEAAKRLQVSIQTIHDWLADEKAFLPGEVVKPAIPRGRTRIKESAIKRLLGE